MLDILMIGLTLAAVYALVAAGLSLMFGVFGIVNFAHGELYMLGAVAIYLVQTHITDDYVLGVLLSVLAMLVVGVLFYALIIRPVQDKPWQRSLIATLALSVLLLNLVILFFGAAPRRVDTQWGDVQLDFFGSAVSLQRLTIIVVTTVVFAALFWMIQRTKTGTAMRAVAQNREACTVVGINVKRVTMITVIIAVGLAGLAGALTAPLTNVWPHMGVQMTYKAFAIVIMGGFGRIQGAIVAAIVVGVVEAFTAAYVSLAFKDIFVFVALLLVLMIRPSGLFGRKERTA